MFKQLKTISEFKSALQDGIICLVDKDDNNNLKFAYYTNNELLIERFSKCDFDFSSKDIEDSPEITKAFNIFSKEYNDLQLHIFQGKAFSLASTKPFIDNSIQLLQLNNNQFITPKYNNAKLAYVIEGEDVFNLVFHVATSNGTVVKQVNDLGVSIDGGQAICNMNTEVKVETGVIVLSTVHDPLFLSDDKKDSITYKKDNLILPAVAYVKNEQLVKITLFALLDE